MLVAFGFLSSPLPLSEVTLSYNDLVSTYNYVLNVGDSGNQIALEEFEFTLTLEDQSFFFSDNVAVIISLNQTTIEVEDPDSKFIIIL